jgi:hypothetical protein
MADGGISWHTHDPGVILTHLAVAIADGADCLADMAALRERRAAARRTLSCEFSMSSSRSFTPPSFASLLHAAPRHGCPPLEAFITVRTSRGSGRQTHRLRLLRSHFVATISI